MAAPLEKEVVSWHPAPGEKPVGVPLVMGELARTAGPDDTLTLFIPGWAEGIESAQAAVETWEGVFGRPAAAAWTSFDILPPTETNLLRIAIGAPQALAEFVGQGRPVNLMMHSLGNLATISAAEAPELFAAICSDSPHSLACNQWAELPGLGSLEVARPLAAIARLGLSTTLQLFGHRKDDRLKAMVSRGKSEIKALGWDAWAAASLAFSDRVSDRAAQSYVDLDKGGHSILIVACERDKVVPPKEVRATLSKTERAAGLPEGYFAMVILPKLPHSPWFLSADVKLAQFDSMLRAQEEAAAK